MSKDVKEFLSGCLAIVIVIAIFFMLATLVSIPYEWWTYIDESRQIESLRQDALNPPEYGTAILVERIVEKNILIEDKKRGDEQWWTTLSVPNGWRYIERIPMPGE